MNFVDVAEAAKVNGCKWALLPFYKNGSPFDGEALQGQKIRPVWGMTLKAAGPMRFRWNETNPNRDRFLNGLCERFGGAGQGEKRIVPLELIHSKIVFDVQETGDTFNKQGDGIVTQNKSLIPVVTVADCVPIYFYDAGTGAFGAAHSGWKGTGIAAQVVELMKKNYGSDPRDILCAIGPHIHDCCYLVDAERAKYFADNFGSDCVQKSSPDNKASQGQNARGGPGLFGQGKNFALSLLRANLNVLASAGVLEENIVAAKNCTACEESFGSFRREAAALDVPAQEKSRLFTTQAAFVIMEGAEVNR
ncbi:MAG: polyphenol oxidase family protein [Treponema sp.]|nr:polyphenol oxidase family protein [Treponema sp.]